MICSECRKAGVKNEEQLFTRAEQLHLKCEYPASCPCAHYTGEGHINPLVTREKP